jgi:hypothetical protein
MKTAQVPYECTKFWANAVTPLPIRPKMLLGVFLKGAGRQSVAYWI